MRRWLQTCPESKKKSLLDLKDKHGFAAVHYAARFNRYKILYLLLLDEASTLSQYTAIYNNDHIFKTGTST